MSKINSYDKQKIIRLFQNNNSVKEIALRFNVSNKRISDILREYIKYGSESFEIKKVGRKSLDCMNEKDKEIYLLKKQVKELKENEEIRKKFNAFLEIMKNKKVE